MTSFQGPACWPVLPSKGQLAAPSSFKEARLGPPSYCKGPFRVPSSFVRDPSGSRPPLRKEGSRSPLDVFVRKVASAT